VIPAFPRDYFSWLRFDVAMLAEETRGVGHATDRLNALTRATILKLAFLSASR
jgi:hypothetical protein